VAYTPHAARLSLPPSGLSFHWAERGVTARVMEEMVMAERPPPKTLRMYGSCVCSLSFFFHLLVLVMVHVEKMFFAF
jgi:hypothetical protein